MQTRLGQGVPAPVDRDRSKDGKPWSVPVNIHRANVSGPLTSRSRTPRRSTEDLDEFFVSPRSSRKWASRPSCWRERRRLHRASLETMLISIMGPEKFSGCSPQDELVRPGHHRRPGNAQEDARLRQPGLPGDELGRRQRLVRRRQGRHDDHGRLDAGVLWSKDFNEFTWQPAPGNENIYQMLSDSFPCPRGSRTATPPSPGSRSAAPRKPGRLQPGQGLDPRSHRRRHEFYTDYTSGRWSTGRPTRWCPASSTARLPVWPS